MAENSLLDQEGGGECSSVGRTTIAGRSDTALRISPWQGISLAAIVSVAVWGTLEAIMPVYVVQDDMQMSGNDVTQEQMQEQRDTSVLYRTRNAMISLSMLAFTLASTIAALELFIRGEQLRAIWSGLLGGLIAAVIASGAGAVGATLLDSLAMPDHRLVKTMIVQSGMLSTMGLAIGLGISLAFFRKQLLLTCTGGCMLGGLLAAFAFPIVASVLLPDLNTEELMPGAGIGRLLWAGLAAGLIGVTVTGLGKERSQPNAQTSTP